MLNKELIAKRIKEKIILPLEAELDALERQKFAVMVEYIEEEDQHKAFKLKQEARKLNYKIEAIKGAL